MKIRQRLEVLQAAAPNKDAATFQLYGSADARRKVYTHIRGYLILRSSLNAHRFHQIIFKKSAGKNPQQWRAWLDANLEKILTGAVLPGLNVMDESQTWSVAKFLGWTGEKTKGRTSDKRKSRNSKVAEKRNQTKRQGARGGKVHIRRRHGNRKRKT